MSFGGGGAFDPCCLLLEEAELARCPDEGGRAGGGVFGLGAFDEAVAVPERDF